MKCENIIFTIPQLHCSLIKMDVNESTKCRDAHIHPAIEIVFVESGSIMCWVNECPVRITENQILIIGSNVNHHLCFDNIPAQICYLQLDVNEMIKLLSPNTIVVPTLNDHTLKNFALFSADSPIYRLLQNIFEEFAAQNTHYLTAALGGFIQLIAYLQRDAILPDPEKLQNSPALNTLLPVVHYINENLGQKISLSDLSSTVHMDKYYFCKVFKKSTGLTPFQYLTRIRTENAEKLLITTNKSVTDIAFECGFSSIQYFTRVFTKAKGCSPQTFRKLYDQEAWHI